MRSIAERRDRFRRAGIRFPQARNAQENNPDFTKIYPQIFGAEQLKNPGAVVGSQC